MSDALLPLFATLPTGTRPYASALPSGPQGQGTSPWSPKGDGGGIDEQAIAAVREQARQEGRAEGLRETEGLRARLAKLVGELESRHEAHAGKFAEAIADAATTVIDAWLGSTDRTAQFAPLVRGWIDHAGGAKATARVNPADVAAMTAAIGEVAISVEADPQIAPGDVRIRGEALDTTHTWRERLRELRDAIAAALEEHP